MNEKQVTQRQFPNYLNRKDLYLVHSHTELGVWYTERSSPMYTQQIFKEKKNGEEEEEWETALALIINKLTPNLY